MAAADPRAWAAPPPSGIRRFAPIVSWLPACNRSLLRFDVIAGATVSGLVPEMIAYAAPADLAAQAGLIQAPRDCSTQENNVRAHACNEVLPNALDPKPTLPRSETLANGEDAESCHPAGSVRRSEAKGPSPSAAG
jgi:hypothetical protein